MPEQDFELLKSVIEITQENDKPGLEYALIKTLARHIKFNAAFLLNIPYGVVHEKLEVGAYISQDSANATTHKRPRIFLQVDEIIQRCIDEGDIVYHQSGSGYRSTYPIKIRDKIIAILLIFADHHLDEDKQLVSLFTQVYSNLLAIQYDNERDTLTSLLNRKAFDLHITELLAEANAREEILELDKERRHSKENSIPWVGVLDIDHFKRINDTYGHLYGDEVLMLFAQIMNNSFRRNDLLFRYGGEEFVVILSPTTATDALMVFNRFRQNLENYDFPRVGQVTASSGMAGIQPNVHPKTVLEQADQALYFSKENGRNRVSNYHQLIDDGLIQVQDVSSDDIEMF